MKMTAAGLPPAVANRRVCLTRQRFALATCLVASFLATPSVAIAADGLAGLVVLARQNDPDYRAAVAARDAGLQARVAGRALLLPSVSAAYDVGNSEVHRDYTNGAAPLNYEANSQTTTWRVSQPLFSLERWWTWREEDARSVLAELSFVAASTELTLRLARAVFDTLLATDNLLLAQAQHTTLVAQRQEAENMRQAGVLTVTEVEDTRARELSFKAAALEAGYALQMRRRELVRMVGDLSQDSPRPVATAPLLPPSPNNLDYWLSRVRDANPKVLAANTAHEMASHATARTKAAHYPTVDLIASDTRTRNPNSYTALERSGGVSLRLNLPIFEGGRTDAAAQRALALKEQARQELDAAKRDAEIKAAEAFLGMDNAAAKTDALAQALIAARTSLRGAMVGRQVGLRTHTEVLNASQQVFAVQRDLNKERYNHALATLQLKALAGMLTDQDLLSLDQGSAQGKH